MAARSIGSVTLAFGLVSVATKIYGLINSASGVSFNLIDKATGSRVKQQYVRATDGTTVVAREEMVKGYEHAKDQYVTFTNEEIKALEEVGTKSIEINEFVPFASIDSVYLDNTYILTPDKAAAKPYALFAQALSESGLVGIGRWANRGKGHVVMIRAIDSGRLAMQLLHFDSEVRKADDFEIAQPQQAIKPAELALAKQLIAQSTAAAYNPAAYPDEHTARVEAAIATKVNGGTLVVEDTQTTAAGPDLMAALQASLAKVA